MAGAEPPVLVAIEGPLATVTLNRPDRLNAVTHESLLMLRDELRRLEANTSVRVVVLTGAGRAFSAGGDMSSLSAGPMDAASVRAGAEVVEVWYRMRPITIAAVNGPCAGGGMSLACAADLRVAAESAFFTTAFLRIGAPGDLGLPWHLARLVGLAKAKELSLLCERLGARDAMRIGLVSRVWPDGDLAEETRSLARAAAGFAPHAASELKRNYQDIAGLSFTDYLEIESKRMADSSGHPDAAEAVRAFVERRQPVFESDRT